MWRTLVTLALATLVLAQPQEKPSFEVASVRPSLEPKPGERVYYGPPRGGPGTPGPTRITWSKAALFAILTVAYDVQAYQVEAPNWLRSARYDIAANVPPGATKEQVNLMWQTLLQERFGLVLHRIKKEFQADDLTVAKGGPHLKPTDLGPDPEPFLPTPGPPKNGRNGLPEMNGYGAIVIISPEHATMIAKALTLSEFAARLSSQLRHPVLDKTNLPGRYDFTLEYKPDLTGIMFPPRPGAAPSEQPSDPGTDIHHALESQLGLKLTRNKAQLEVLIIDHAEKTPTEN